MTRLKIFDISFCETANTSQVRGGLSEDTAGELDILDWLKIHLPGFSKLSSEKKGEYLLEKFSDQTGKNLGYRTLSLDGKQILSGASGQIDNITYAFSSNRSST